MKVFARLVAVLGVLMAGAEVSAQWSGSTAQGGGTRAVALTMAAGLAPSASVVPPTGSTVTVSWPAPSGGAPISGYELVAYRFGTELTRSLSGTCAGLVAGFSCTDTGVPDGAWQYRVTPRTGHWSGALSEPSAPVVVDVTPPVPALAFPANGALYTAATWNGGCPTSGICGSATDPTGVASVAVSIRSGTGNYWNGTGFASASEVLVPATGTTTWSYAFPATAFPTDGAYTVRVVATNLTGGTASVSATFTIDRTAPQVTGLTLQNRDGFFRQGDAVNITYSEPIRPSSICSAWSASGNQSLTNATIVMVNSGLRDIPTISSPTCTLRIGTSTSATSYVLSNSTFTPSTVTWTESTRTLRIVAGSYTSGLLNLLPQLPHTSNYTPDAAITDLAGNPIATTTFTSANQSF